MSKEEINKLLPNGLKVKKSTKGDNGIIFSLIEGHEDIYITLRGQPNINGKGMGVNRLYCYSNKGWSVNKDYEWDGIITTNMVDCEMEGSSNATKLCLISKKQGLIEIPIINNNFVVGKYVNEGRRDCKYPSPYLKNIPDDIKIVYALK